MPTAPQLPAEMLLRYTGVPEDGPHPGAGRAPERHATGGGRPGHGGLGYLLPACAKLGAWTEAHLLDLPGYAGSGNATILSWNPLRPSTGTCGRGGGDHSGVAARRGEAAERLLFGSFVVHDPWCTITTASVHLWTFLSGALGRPRARLIPRRCHV